MLRINLFVLLCWSVCIYALCGEYLIHSSYVDSVLQPVGANVISSDSVILIGENVGSDNVAIIHIMWSLDSLYVSFRVADTMLVTMQTYQDHPQLFLDDMVEFLIDPLNHRDSCWNLDDRIYHINLNGVIKDDCGTTLCQTDCSWNTCGRVEVALQGMINDHSDSDYGYHIVLIIPWSELNIVPYPGLHLSANFVVGDNDLKGRQLFDWTGAFPFRNPSMFGYIILE